MPEPKFQHDCDNCEYLGKFFDMDVYLCRPSDRGILGGSIIARYSDEAPDYYSSPISVLRPQLEDPEHRIGLGVDGPSMPMQEWLFSSEVCTYYKAWLLALALMPIKQLLKERDEREQDAETPNDEG